jgi:hypothetical protein
MGFAAAREGQPESGDCVPDPLRIARQHPLVLVEQEAIGASTFRVFTGISSRTTAR